MEEEEGGGGGGAMKKHLEFGRIVKVAVVFTVVVVSCLVLYSASYSNKFPLLPHWSTWRREDNLFSNENEQEELQSVLRRASMENNTVILTTLNKAWSRPNSILDLFLESFRVGNDTLWLMKHLVVVATDSKAYSRCLDYRLNCYLLKGQSARFSNEARFMSPTYMEMMWRRQELLLTVLRLGYNYVFTDTDIMWLRNPFPHFYQDADLQIACDRFNGNSFDMKNPANNGFSFARSNNRTIQFYKLWVSSRKKYPRLHEQAVLDKIKYYPFTKRIGFRMRFLDTDRFSGFCQRSKDFSQVCTMHANCCLGMDKKIHDLKLVLEDWQRYMNSSPSERASQHFQWSRPKKC